MPQNLIAIKIAQSAVLAAASTVASAASIAIQLSTPHQYLGLQIEYKYFLIASIVLCFMGACGLAFFVFFWDLSVVDVNNGCS